MIIEGTVEEIIFRAEDTGFTVGVVEHNGEYSSFVGKMIPLHIGEMVKLEGKFVTNQKFGEQFACDTVQKITPKTSESIYRYLSSGLIKGVGPKTAELIVNKFKEKSLEVLENAPLRLAEIKGISIAKANQIGEQFFELKNVQNVIMFLQGFEITINRALKIYEKYGAKTIEKMQSNPYILVEDIEGIGFNTADKIAVKMGIEETSSFRFRAGILHILQEASEKNGHTFLPKEMLLALTANLLGLDQESISKSLEGVLESMSLDNVIKVFWSSEYEIVMLAKFFYTENSVATKLALLVASSKTLNLNIDKEIDSFEKKMNISFHSEQKKAIQTAVNEGVCVITGGPGTGKTTIVQSILNILKQAGNRTLVLAPTGRAAKRLCETTGEEAKTIHRALGLDFRSEQGFFLYNDTNPLQTDAVIVDEVSMVDITLMFNLLKAIPRGCKLVLVGDKDQLPSVGAGNVLSDILASQEIPVVYLTKIFRQDSNSLIIANAHSINEGELPNLSNTSKDFFFEKKETPILIKESIIALASSRIPSYFNIDSSHIQILAPLKAGTCGTIMLNKELQAVLNPPSKDKHEILVGENTIFREQDKIMQMQNNYEIEWVKNSENFVETGSGVFNGDIGTILKMDYSSGEVLILYDDGRLVKYPRNELFQLSLAYAVTIHKSQGSEFDAVVVPIIAGAPLILTRNLIYTAVTRAKKLVVMVGTKENLSRMISNNHTEKRYTMLSEFLKKSISRAKEMYE
ncbi:MAG: ATP-dependent RecD-like DNA helicase [Clostridia bacterium]